MSIVAAVTAVGDVRYGSAARQTVLSILERTDFAVHLACDPVTVAFAPESPRVRVHRLEPRLASRPDPFLAKFDAWHRTLECSDADIVVHVDADAVVVDDITEEDVREALGPCDLAMVEQRGITGSNMDRTAFHAHFLGHSHRALAPLHRAPPVERFRFHNSGVVMFRSLELRNFLRWADSVRHDPATTHEIGRHMIADQDYLQVWVNLFRADSCADLDWSWNHCKWWDPSYPDPRARIVHLSNFCEGPPLSTTIEMQRLRHASAPVVGRDQRPVVSFVVVTHESGAVVGDCLAALAQVRGGEVIVVDNASTDGPPAVPDGVHLCPQDRNLGFAAGANVGARLASADVVCFVNPDCVVTADLVTDALGLLGADPATAVVPDYVDGHGTVASGIRPGYTSWRLVADIIEGSGHPGLAARLAPGSRRDDDSWSWPLAACMFVDRARFLTVGGFEESYRCYMEDVEFGRTWHRAGGTFTPTGIPAIHLGATGSAITPATRRALLDASRIHFARRHHGRAFAAMLGVLRRGLTLTARTRALARQGRT